MANFNRHLTGHAMVAGEQFHWHVHREPQWCEIDGWKGLALAVRHVDGQRRAILEWPMPRPRSSGVPYRQRPEVPAVMVQQGIASAIAAGWDPMSQGKSVKIIIEEKQPQTVD